MTGRAPAGAARVPHARRLTELMLIKHRHRLGPVAKFERDR